jgi:hypothetical protein
MRSSDQPPGELTMREEIGLSWVAAECDDLEDLPVEELDCLAERGPVQAMLRVAERSVTALSRPAAVRLGQDVRRLLESSLPDATIRTVWLGATDHVFDPAVDGITARAWLRKMEQAWLSAERRDDPAFVPTPAAPETDERLRQDVLQAIGRVGGDLRGTDAVELATFAREKLGTTFGAISFIGAFRLAFGIPLPVLQRAQARQRFSRGGAEISDEEFSALLSPWLAKQ